MININFKAAVLTKTNKPLNILNLSYKKLLKGQVLVKIHFSGICGSQLMEIKGDRGEDKWLPHCLGHEASGEVVACGPGAKKFKKGDKVILTWIKSCGNESSQIRFFNGKQIVNAGKITTFSNFSIVSENRIVKKPKTLSMKEAVLFGCAIPTGFGMVVNQIKPKKSMKIHNAKNIIPTYNTQARQVFMAPTKPFKKKAHVYHNLPMRGASSSSIKN